MRSRWPALALLALFLAPPLWAGGRKSADVKSEGPKAEGKVYHVPYRLTDTQHILVRVKINGKGPFNFIVDTGAPLLYVAEPVAKKIGLPLPKKKSAEKKDAEKQDANPEKTADKKDADKKGRGGVVTLDRFEIEGGVVIEKAKAGNMQAAAIAANADGVVVGSALIDALRGTLDAEEKATPATIPAVTRLVSALAEAVRTARPSAAEYRGPPFPRLAA